MKKIFNYFILKISSFKIGIVFLVAFIYQLYILSNVTSVEMNYNVYDISIIYFSYLSLFYSVNLFYLIITYEVCNNSNFFKYLFLKFKSRIQVFNINVIITFMLSAIFVIFINVICIIESIGNTSFNNSWSQYFFWMADNPINSFHTTSSIQILSTKLTPVSFTLYNNLFVILYLFVLGLIFIVSNIIFKKRAFSFMLVILINAISRVLDGSYGIVAKLTFTKNVFLINSTLEQLKNNTFITSRLLYFGVLIVSLIVIGNILTKKLDYKFQGEK